MVQRQVQRQVQIQRQVQRQVQIFNVRSKYSTSGPNIQRQVQRQVQISTWRSTLLVEIEPWPSQNTNNGSVG